VGDYYIWNDVLVFPMFEKRFEPLYENNRNKSWNLMEMGYNRY